MIIRLISLLDRIRDDLVLLEEATAKELVSLVIVQLNASLIAKREAEEKSPPPRWDRAQ